jgi:hypothetical protein
MVEAVITVPFFIGIFLALTFVGSLYIAKQKTVSLSRQAAWTYAMNNCEGSMPDVSSKDDGNLGQDLSGMGQYQGAPGGDVGTKGFQMASSAVEGEVSTKNGGKTFYDQKVKTGTWVTCNEKPVDGDLKGVLSFAWNLLAGI